MEPFDKVFIFKDEKGDWRWKLVARNNEIIAIPGEGYKNLNHCLKMVRRIFPGLGVDDLEIEG